MAGYSTMRPIQELSVQDDDHLHVVCRYVERNALAAGLVQRGRLALREPLEWVQWDVTDPACPVADPACQAEWNVSTNRSATKKWKWKS